IPLEQVPNIINANILCKDDDKPKRAGDELSLDSGQPVIGLRCRVARYESIPSQLPPDGVDSSRNPFVGAREESDERDVEDARVQFLRPVVLGEGPAIRVVATLADLPVDLVANLLPPL